MEQPGVITVRDKEIPVRKKGEALLRMLVGGICGTDISSYRGKMPYMAYPRIPGHEFSAEIIEIDKNTMSLEKGMVVTGNPYFNCDKCYSCVHGRVNCCMDSKTMGVQMDGAFSEFFTMPVERLYDGKGMSPEHLALVEPFCISYHGVHLVDVKQGDSVLVMGAGTIGIFAALVAKTKGAEVTLCDVSSAKLGFAEDLGFTSLVRNVDENSTRAMLSGITRGNGFDITIEAVGLASTFLTCIEAAAFGGTVIQIGVSHQNVDFGFTVIQKKELTIHGSRNALKKDFLSVIGLFNSQPGLLAQLDRIITHTYRLDDAAQAFAELDTKGEHMLKVEILF